MLTFKWHTNFEKTLTFEIILTFNNSNMVHAKDVGYCLLTCLPE